MIKIFNYFLTKIEELKLYIVKFNKNNKIKARIFLFNYIINDKKSFLKIIITYNKYIF